METDRTCIVADVFPRWRPGFPEARNGETPEIFMDLDIFQSRFGRLVATRMRHKLRRRHSALALHPEEIPVQSSLSPHQPLVCVRNDSRVARFRRGSAILKMDRPYSRRGRMFFNHEMI